MIFLILKMQVRPCACHYPIDLPVIYMHIYISLYIQDRCQRIVFVYYQFQKLRNWKENYPLCEGVFISCKQGGSKKVSFQNICGKQPEFGLQQGGLHWKTQHLGKSLKYFFQFVLTRSPFSYNWKKDDRNQLEKRCVTIKTNK